MSKQEINIDDKYNILIYTYLSNQASAKEKQILLEWLRDSDENIKYYKEYRNLYDIMIHTGVSKIFTDNKLGDTVPDINLLTAETDKIQRIVKRKISFYFGAAAVIFIIFSIGALSSFLFRKVDSEKQMLSFVHEIIVPNGGKSELVLPDGTIVWLNAGSHFWYKGDYGHGSRNVFLVGEGYFKVIKNPRKPFIVDVYGLKIKALGTTFNIKAYPNEKVVTTTLVEGLVKIEGKGVKVSLLPKQLSTINKETLETATHDKSIGKGTTIENTAVKSFQSVQLNSNVNTNIYTAWKDDIWIINSESLEDISQELERKFNVTIQVESPKLRQFKFSGTFNKETLEQILDVIKLTAPINYQINKGVVVIREEEKRSAIYNDYIK